MPKKIDPIPPESGLSEPEIEPDTAADDAQPADDQPAIVTHQPRSADPTPEDRVAELTTDLQRLQAEFQNFRRRADADRADLMSLATARIAREFLAVRDSFDAEAQHRPPGADLEWAKSIDAIRTQFDQVLTTLGVTRFASLGQPFDPRRHEAVASEGDGNTVIEELQPGYELGGRILRPAMVKVGPAPANDAN